MSYRSINENNPYTPGSHLKLETRTDLQTPQHNYGTIDANE